MSYVCKRCIKAGFPAPHSCCYCDGPIDEAHEHDHAPIPKRHGGEQVMPVCTRCHNIKDRLMDAYWDQEKMLEAIEGLDTNARIIVATACAMYHDARHKSTDEEAA